jgi:hypothetical protein
MIYNPGEKSVIMQLECGEKIEKYVSVDDSFHFEIGKTISITIASLSKKVILINNFL